MNTKIILGALLGASAAAVSGLAMARVDVGVNIGVPAPVYVQPPPVVYQPAPVYAVGMPAVVIGWHGDRYWDGRRYWARDDWNRHHGGGYHDHHDDHRDHNDHHDH
jgi:hypothetical protein